MDMKLLLGVLPFIGVVIGAVLQYFFTKHIEAQRHSRELKSKAYMDYLKSVAEHAQRLYEVGTLEHKGLFVRTADAKCRICLYGSKEAISAFSKFEELGASMNSEEQISAFTEMVSIMRSDSGSPDTENSRELQNVIIGVRR